MQRRKGKITRNYTNLPNMLRLHENRARNILVIETTKPALAGFEAAWQRRQALHAKVSGESGFNGPDSETW